MSAVLSKKERLAAMAKLSGWSEVEGRDGICKTFKFKNFSAAIGWMVQVAIKAEQIDHHPEWCNVYNRVEVTLTTHSVGGLTQLDVELADYMDLLAG